MGIEAIESLSVSIAMIPEALDDRLFNFTSKSRILSVTSDWRRRSILL